MIWAIKPMTAGKRLDSNGFTLLEVMIAVAIIATAFTAVLGLQSQGVSLASESRFNTMAPLLAQRKMAQMESITSEELSADSGDFGEDFPGYTWQIDVQDVAFEGLSGLPDYLKRIDLRVAWGKSRLYQYHLRLYKFIPKSK